MNLLNRFKQAIGYLKALGLNDPKAWSSSIWNLAGTSVAGETVTEETALTNSAVYNAVSLISGTIGALPLHLMQKKGDKKRIADERTVYSVLHDSPNPFMTAMAFREAIMAHVLLWGNGYAEIVRNGYGEVVELWPITPNRVSIGMESGKVYYTINMGNQPDVILPREKVLHIPGLGFDGFQGYSVVAMARKSFGLGMAMESYGAKYYENGTHPGVIVSHPGTLKDPAKLRDALTSAYYGLGQSNRLMLLEEAMKIERVTIPNADGQYLESRQFAVTEVARWFNLPPHKIKDLTKSSFNNIESEQISFVTDSILPWLVRLEQNYNLQILDKYDRDLSGRGRYYFKHSVEGLLRGDAASRAAFYTVMLDRGVFSINEVRELEDKDPVEGGNIHLVPLNMTSLEYAGKPPVAPAPATPEKGTVPDDTQGGKKP